MELARYSGSHQLDPGCTVGRPGGERRKLIAVRVASLRVMMGARGSVAECSDLKTGPTPVACSGAVEAASISNYQGFAAPLPRP